MPCYDGRDNERQVLVTYEHEQRIRNDCRHNSDVAELLCYLLTKSPTARKYCEVNPALAKWWKQHQARDAKKTKGK